MKVFVAGATGVLGRAAVPSLLAAGHTVIGTARGEARTTLLRNLGAEPVDVDLFDATTLMGVIGGCDAVLRLATKIPPLRKMRLAGAWQENDRIRRDASRVLVDAAMQAGVPRYVGESYYSVLADGGDAWLDESAPLDAPLGSPLHSAVQGEAEVARFTEGGGIGVVLRFAGFYGADAPATLEVIGLLRRRMLPLFSPAAAYLPSIYTGDLGSAIVAALSVPAGIYHVGDDEPVRQREYFEGLAEALGLPRPSRLPAPVAPVLVGTSTARLLQSSIRLSNRRLKEAAGWAPSIPCVREGWPLVARQLQERGAL